MGIAVALLVVAGPALAQTEPSGGTTTEEPKFANKDAEECFKLLEEGKTVDDCQQAPNPLLPEVNEIIWGSLAFLVLFLAMLKWGVPAVRNMEKAREDRIRNDLESAERARQEAESEKQDYERQIADARNEAGRIIEEARQAAEIVRRDLTTRAEGEAREIRERAQADIGNQRAQALAQLHDDVAALSIELASRIVERNLDTETNRQLVESFLEQAAR